MKRWVFILIISASLSFGIGIGLRAAVIMHDKAYLEGSMHRSAEFYLQAQDFADSLKHGKTFINGGWEFVRVGKKKSTYVIREVTVK